MAMLIDIRQPEWMTEQSLRDEIAPLLPDVPILAGLDDGDLSEVTMLTAVKLFPGVAAKLPKLQVIQKLVKQCTDAASQFVDGNREDLAEKERANIAVMEEYLPAKMDEAEVDRIINDAIAETGASSMKEMGKVMGLVKSKVQGRADMAAVSGRIKALLS